MIQKRAVRLISLILIFVFTMLFIPSVTLSITGGNSHVKHTRAIIIRYALNHNAKILIQESFQEQTPLSAVKLPGLSETQNDLRNHQDHYLSRSDLITALGKFSRNSIAHYFHGTKYKDPPAFI